MRYYSTNKSENGVSLRDAVIKGLAADGGLYMPDEIKRLPKEFFEKIDEMSLTQIAKKVAENFFGDDIEKAELEKIIDETLNFDIPLVKVADGIFSLELFHGPTLAFKDVGARFMSRILGYFIKKENLQQVNVLVATSGDTGSAVANGFLGVDGIKVHVLYPKGKVSKIQECQFTTLGKNITALEVDGTFDDCQRLVKSAFSDKSLNAQKFLTSANSINVARFLPQAFYYFYAYAQLKKMGLAKNVVISVPSGNFGNLTAGLFAKEMGLPISYFIAANNRNDIFLEYLKTKKYSPRASVASIANAMDVGNPSNMARIFDLYGNSYEKIADEIKGTRYTDEEISATIVECLSENSYLLDPHGACGFQALKDLKKPDEIGIFLETAHPAKFKDTVDEITKNKVEIPAKLREFMKGEKQSVPMSADFEAFKNYLLNEA